MEKTFLFLSKGVYPPVVSFILLVSTQAELYQIDRPVLAPTGSAAWIPAHERLHLLEIVILTLK